MDSTRLYGRSLQTPCRELTDGVEGDAQGAIGGRSLPLALFSLVTATTSSLFVLSLLFPSINPHIDFF